MTAIEATASADAGQPTWVTATLAAAGIDPDGSVAALREHMTARELELLEVGQEWTSVPHGTPRYVAAVADLHRPDTRVGLHWSGRGIAAAVAGAIATVLRERADAGRGRTHAAAKRPPRESSRGARQATSPTDHSPYNTIDSLE